MNKFEVKTQVLVEITTSLPPHHDKTLHQTVALGKQQAIKSLESLFLNYHIEVLEATSVLITATSAEEVAS